MGSPARLDYARNLAAKRVEAETNTTEFELTVVAASSTANFAATLGTYREFRGTIEFCELTGTRHLLYLCFLFKDRALTRKNLGGLSCAEGHSELLEECATFIVGERGSYEGDVHSLNDVDTVIVDFGENDLLFEAEGVVALAVEGLPRNTAKVASSRKRECNEAIKELPHARAAERNHCADR
jgi:hypothetical protein